MQDQSEKLQRRNDLPMQRVNLMHRTSQQAHYSRLPYSAEADPRAYNTTVLYLYLSTIRPAHYCSTGASDIASAGTKLSLSCASPSSHLPACSDAFSTSTQNRSGKGTSIIPRIRTKA